MVLVSYSCDASVSELKKYNSCIYFWFGGTVSASVLGVAYILNKKTKRYYKLGLDVDKKGIKLSVPMLIAALALRGFSRLIDSR